MARKKRLPDGESPKERRQPKPAPDSIPRPPDPRRMEQMLRQVGGQRGVKDVETPAARAQALLRQAQEEEGGHGAPFARAALAADPNCADAYLFLAEEARGRSRKEALGLYEQAVAAGERALGPQAFQEKAGHFWFALETRPYMRARLELAHALWARGQRDTAVGHLQDLLRLNPNDNQGVRYTLAGFLLFLDRDADLARLLEQYAEENSASWAYTKALLAFRQRGDTIDARRLLKQAKKTNKYVPAYLTGAKFPPAEQPMHYRPGTESEALDYVQGFLAGWKATAGAVAWVRANGSEAKKRKAAGPEAKGPLPLVKKRLSQRLAQTAEVWQADSRQLPLWVRGAGEPLRPWAILVVSHSHGVVLTHEILEVEPSSAFLWDTLLEAMQHPADGAAHRPTQVQVRPHERWEELRPHLAEIGVELVVTEELGHMEAVFEDLAGHLGGPPALGLLDIAGIRPEQVAHFYEAAALFYQQAPWKQVGCEGAIRVECDRFQGGPWYAVLMGQSGLTMGLALYEDLAVLRRMFAGTGTDEENARQTVATTVTFGEAIDIPVADLDAGTRYGWKVARPDAYPAVFHKERGLSMRPPLAWELELLEGCLRAVPEFVKRHQPEEQACAEMTVPVASGELQLALSWVVEGGE